MHLSNKKKSLQSSKFKFKKKYEGESVNRSQMDIKHKTCDIRSWKKHLLLDIRSTNYIPLSHSFTGVSKPTARKSFDCCLSHFRIFISSSATFRTSLREFLDPDANRFTRKTLPTVNRKHFFMSILCIESFCPQKQSTTQHCSSVGHSSSMVTILTTETSL
jgi:hypothetical protein